MDRPLALVIDDEPDICKLLEITLDKMSIQVISAYNVEQAKQLLKEKSFDICLTDMRLPDGDGLDLVSYVQVQHPQLPIAIITAHGNMETAIKALKNGAFDFISKPVDLTVLRNIISTALKVKALAQEEPDRIIGTSTVIQQLRTNIAKVARSQAPIYISGPSGSGKELVAKVIHESGPRRDFPFIPVNCGAIPQELMESEFFGHLKGSFTGATYDKVGFFQAAHQGTLFLDEIAELPLTMQVKLLRAIQEKAIRPVGATKETVVDVRILCATHKNLSELVAKNLFRQDLFYRLNVIEIRVPSLQERQSDIPAIANFLLEKISANNQSRVMQLDPSAIQTLMNYRFPGNVRELENILERAMTLCDGNVIRADDLQLPTATLDNAPAPGDDQSLDDYLINLERNAIVQALEQANGNKTKAAKLLGVSFRTLRYRLKKLDLDND